MTISLIRRTLLTALAVLTLPAALAAQQKPAQSTAVKSAAPAKSATAAKSAAPQEIQGWVNELQQLHGKLQAIQEKALEDPALQASQDALGASIKAAMEKADPSLPKSMARVQALETEAAAAQKSGDQAKLQQLASEAQQIQERFMAAQQVALRQPDLAGKVDVFQQQLEKKMIAVDPAATQLIARFKELNEKLSASMEAAGQP